MTKKNLMLCMLLIVTVSLSAQSKTDFTGTVADVSFELQKVKAIGSELRAYFLITNSAKADKELTIRANDHRLWDGKGNEYSSEYEIIADKKMSTGSFVTKNFIEGIPIKACFVFNKNNVSELSEIKMLQIKTNAGAFRIKDIPLPFGEKPVKDKKTLEIEDNVFISFTEIKPEGENLRLYFLVENKTPKDIKVTFRGNSQRIVDNTGTEYKSNVLEFASVKRTSSSMQSSNMVQNIPVKGYFEFPKAGSIEKIMLFEMSTFNNSFRLKNLKIE